MEKMINKRDLSVIIAARNEEFLKRTVEGVLKNRRANTEVIVILDGAWAKPQLKCHPDVTIIYHPESIGQRAAVNEGARISRAKFVMKLDAHCIVDEGFDVKLMEECDYKWTVVPTMYNLHAFNWRCKKCGNEWYQGPTPKHCMQPGESRKENKECDGKDFERVMVWKRRKHRRSNYMRFDSDLHFQYWGGYGKRPEAKAKIAPIMSFIGACWFMHRKRYWELEGLDEDHGSWGQVGTEVACKSWLSGGELVVNKKTWFAHMFRTQGGDFGFPYKLSGKQTAHAREHSKKIWRGNKWGKAIHPLRWLVKKFWPVPGWTVDDLKKIGGSIGQKGLKKGIIYYTDNQLKLRIAHACKLQIKKIGLPIVSASLKPMQDMGKNIHVQMKRGYMAYFTQILRALEESNADIIYFCEHDWLYHPSHFEFTPEKKNRYYYNDNWWRLRYSDGHAIRYDTHLLPSICGFRETLLEHYTKRMDRLKKGENSTKEILRMGFEPGTHNRKERIDDIKAEGFKSKYPNIDIRHDNNLTSNRWSKDQFRSQRNCRNWQESNIDNIPGWTDLRHKLKIN